ncbi:MAG: FeoA family protein [Endomicrobiia bacterium]
MKKLTEVKPYKKFVITHIDAGVGMVKRLETLGIRKNVQMQKISQISSRGPVILSFINSNYQIAIGHGMAKKIFVTEI